MRRATRIIEWEAAYKGGIITTRSSLHVLHKIDAKRSLYLAEAVKARFQAWKSTTESNFLLLDDERNMILKEGRFFFRQEVQESSYAEPRLLFGSQILVGSEIVRSLANWALEEIERIEENAFWVRRADRTKN